MLFSSEIVSQLREYVEYVAFLGTMFPSGWFFGFSSSNTNFLFLLRHFFALLPCGTSQLFSFDLSTSFMMRDTSISTTEWKLKRRGFRGYFLYPDSLIREFIFSLAFLFRLPLDSASRLLTAFFNGLLFSTSSITLILARKASFPIARAPLFRKGSIFLNNPPRKLPIPCPC